MSLTEPTAKMSKSHEAERSRILITDSPDQIRSKVASALTDSLPGISYDTAARPGISNLLDILSAFDAKGRTALDIADECDQMTPRQLKALVSDSIICGLQGFSDRYRNLLDDRGSYLEFVEAEGARKARKSAEETMHLVRSAVGI